MHTAGKYTSYVDVLMHFLNLSRPNLNSTTTSLWWWRIWWL